MSLIRGVLLAGRFRTQHELDRMSDEDQRNTLIVELARHSSQSDYQRYDSATLAGFGAVMVFLRTAGIRDDAALARMTADDQRNTLIVELDGQTHLGRQLQGLDNLTLVRRGLGDVDAGIGLRQPSFVRGVLLAGQFRTHHELNRMSDEDMRNTLIVELAGRTRSADYQALDDYALAGVGAVLVFLRTARIRDDRAIADMTADGMRNTLIVELDGQTHLGARLQGLRNLDLVRLGLGVDPAIVLAPLPPPLQPERKPVELTAPIASGGLAALGGWVAVTINPDGTVRWRGHAHDSGADGYDFAISAVVRTPSGRAIALAHAGHVGGTFSSGARDHDWDETLPSNALVNVYFEDFVAARLDTNLAYESSLGAALAQAVSWLVRWGAGTLSGPAGAVIFVGVEIGSLISTGSLVPGARLAEDVLWMAGPANTLFAIIAHGIAALGSRTRELTQDEYDWANAEVFLGALPPRDRLVLTDTIGGDNRAFTFPRFDGKITLNLGEAAFADPRVYPGRAYGQTFIHELVHACQIHHARIDLALLADALANKVCEVTGDPYAYGPAGADYTSFNLEQQAQIVSDWFAGARPPGANQTGIAKDMASPYFRYITDNVRIGRF